MSKSTRNMTEGPLMPQIIAFSIPLALTGLLQLVYNAADMMVVGRFAGSKSLAAVGATSMLVNLTVNLFIGLSTGAGVVVARHIGAGEKDDAHRAVHTTMLLGAVSGVFVMIVGVLLSSTFLRWMGTPDDIIDLSSLYLRIYFVGAPANMIYNYGASVLRASGDSKHPFYYLTAAGLINIGLNLLLVIKFNLDVAGVAYATITSQYISAVLVVMTLLREKSFLKLSIKKLRFYKKELKEIIRIGLPAGIQSSLFSISNVLIQSSVNSFGSVVVAGNTAAANIDSIIYTCCYAVSQSAMTFSSQNYGAMKIDRIKKTYIDCMITAGLLSLTLSGLFYFFRVPLLGIFTTDSEVIKAGCVRLVIMTSTYWINSLMDVTTCQLRGIGRSLSPMVVTIAGVCGFRIVWLATYFKRHQTLEVLFYSYPISWVMTITALIVCFIIAYRSISKKISKAE